MDESMDALSTRDLGGFLITNRAVIDAAESKWLQHLAEFDRRCGFAVDGHRDCVSWLIHKCGLARSTAKERLRIARELQHRGSPWPTPWRPARCPTPNSGVAVTELRTYAEDEPRLM